MPEPTPSEPLVRMADGTVKQVNPLSGTQVWTVPGRADRPLPTLAGSDRPLDHGLDGRFCAFCEQRYLDTTPEKARLIREGHGWHTLTGLTAEELFDTVAQFRLIANLFEIVSVDYWRLNHGLEFSELAVARWAHYVSTPGGRAHLDHLLTLRSQSNDPRYAAGSPQRRRLTELGFFGGFHDVVVARRHHVDGAEREDQLAASGTLTPGEHREYIDFTVGAIEWMFEMNPLIRNVAAFQNWLRPAGASFDHLHKQVVAIDELSVETQRQLERVREDPWIYAHLGVGYAAERGLVIAENRHAVAVAGVGHRYPSVVVYSKSATREPWRHTAEELRGFSDLVHAMHAATGPQVPVNEQWYHEPPGIGVAMPFRVVVSLRISTLAGFEGGTKIYINTIDPWTLAQRFVASLLKLRALGAVADFDIGPECTAQWASLKYARVGASHTP